MFLTTQKALKSWRGGKLVPSGGETVVTWQAYVSDLLPLAVNVGMTSGVGEKKTKITVAVAVGVTVSVLRVGTGVHVMVAEGNPAAVWVAAALAVCTIMVSIAPGSTVGMDSAVSEGTHAMISIKAVNQASHFVFVIVAISSSSNTHARAKFVRLWVFNDNSRIRETQAAFHHECHCVGALLIGGLGIHNNDI